LAALDMTGQAALVVGGGQGIGRAAALALGRAGARVAVLDAEADRARFVVGELEALGVGAAAVVADVTQAEGAARGVADAGSALGPLDVVVNIVGSASWGSLLDLDEATWERDFTVNLKQHWYVGRSAARAWIATKRPGALAVVASVSGLFSAPKHGAYGAAKAGVLAFVRTAAEEWWPHGIRVNAVIPGTVRTPRIEALWTSGEISKPTPETLARMALPEDIANAALFFVSPLAQRVTGQTLVVDGGTTTRFPYQLGS
jgi:NAD(P)-dependent dehydrogenase (short-subunit alcohol dehydrogenase family)